MFMKPMCRIIIGAMLLILLPLYCNASDVQHTKFPIPGDGFLELTIPEHFWAISEKSKDDGQLGILIQARSGIPFAGLVFVALRQDGEAEFGKPAHLERSLRIAAQPYIKQMGGMTLTLEKLSGGTNSGIAYSYTDEVLVGKPMVPNEYPYLRQGVVCVGRRLLLTYSVFMHHLDPNPVAPIEQMLLNAKHLTE